MAEQTSNSWHLDKKVPISLIAAILFQFAVALLAYADLKKDVELLKQDAGSLHARDAMHEDQMKEALRLMQEQYQRLDSKLDRLIERSGK
ncbi:hypothetical protein [Rhodoferax sp. GW822-FHT02A01]|uniref:hypothetical protein n=1 Tax=Rhodoferax sp. GW822-FHT02A01 TaxID=3141537 RepID=UPI00315C6DF7